MKPPSSDVQTAIGSLYCETPTCRVVVYTETGEHKDCPSCEQRGKYLP